MTTTTLDSTAYSALGDGSDATYLDLSAGFLLVQMDSKTLATGEVTKTITPTMRYLNGVVYASQDGGGTFDWAFNQESSATTAVGSSYSINWSQSQIDELAILLLDGGPSTGRVYEFAVDLITVAQPSVAVVAVSPDPYTSTNVPLAWTNTLDSDGGGQTRYEVKVFTATTGTPGTTTAYWETGERVSSAISTTLGPLENGDTYYAYARVAQTVNGASHWSDWSSVETFAISATTADVGSVAAVATDADGKITVTVTKTGATAWEYIEVERSTDSGTTWSSVRGASFVAATGASPFVVVDYEVPNGQSVTYRARATYYLTGQAITGSWVSGSADTWSSTDDWIKAPLAPALNMVMCPSMVGPTTRSTRSGVFNVVGKAAPVVVSDALSSPVGGQIMYRTEGATQAGELDDLLEGCGGVLLINLKTLSTWGPDRNGFAYIAVIGTTETWADQYYRTGDVERRFVTISYVEIDAPGDATAGTI